MRTLFESLLDIDSIETDTNVAEFLMPLMFQKLYKRKSKSIDIEENNPIYITGNVDSMQKLCQGFKTKNINISGVYPESKIKSMFMFANNCGYLKKFKGPNKHINYSEVNSLQNFFSADINLEDFDLSGIAESTKNIENIDHMFATCDSLKVIDLSKFDFSKLNHCIGTFTNCKSLRQINMGNSNAVANAMGMCQLDINLEEFNAPNMILSGRDIFYDCESLRHINVRYIDVSDEYYNIFEGCSKLEDVNISGFGRNTKYSGRYIDLSWAISLNDKSWDFLFKNLNDGNDRKIKLPDTPKKEKLIEKYGDIAKKHNFELI